MNQQRKYLLKIEYNGQPFHGWQIQPNGITVQEKLEQAFQTVLRKKVHVDAASRTDAGVHAASQLATVVILYENISNLFRSINALVYPHISIINYTELPLNFLIRKHTKNKEYQYNCYVGNYKVFLDWQAWWIRKPVNIDIIRQLLPKFVGEQDFKAFRSDGCSSPITIKTITKFDLKASEIDQNTILKFTIQGSGFLRHMIRIMIGTIIQIAIGKLEFHTVEKALKTGLRAHAGMTAPAKGLLLKNIQLNQDYF